MELVPASDHYRWVRIVAVLALAMCVGSVLVLTLLIPQDPGGGYLPIKSPTASAR